MVGADSRTSVSGYVSNRVATKISFILENDFGLYALPPSSNMQMNSIFLKGEARDNMKEYDDKAIQKENNIDGEYSSTCCICRSGSAADTQYIADAVRHQLRRRMVLHSRSSSVSEAAHLLKNYLNNDKVSASLICAGYDHILGEGLIYSIDLGGTMMMQKGWACNGSGSTYILGIIDDLYPQTEDSLWDEEEAVNFVKKAIGLAIERDGSSGGVIRIFVINRDGKKGIVHVPEFNHAPKGQNNENTGTLSKFAPPSRR